MAIGYQLGVDLGTTFTAAALVRDGRAEPVTLGNHGVSVPSVVFLGADGGLLVGEPAVLRSASEPTRVAREFKRRVGDPAPILVGGAPVAAELLMARTLDWVVAQVARTEGGPPTALAVTHPANWGEYKLDLLRQAVRHVGLRADQLVPEPVAAARFYATQRRLAPGTVVAVYDLGGGTFDAAVVRVEDEGFALLGRPEGIERLGGIDFDQAVFGHVLTALGLDEATLDLDDGALRSGLAVLRRDCVEAKEALSNDTDVAIPVMLPSVHTQVRLTRGELEAMVRPALAETVVALRRAVVSAGVPVEELAAVLLVGGSSRIPLVGQLVGAELGRPIAVDARPKDAISLGAAFVAAEAVPAPPALLPPPVPPPPVGPTRKLPEAPEAPGGARSPVAGRRRVRAAVAVVAVAALVVAVLAVRGDGDGGGGDDGGSGDTADRPTTGYDPAVDGAIADRFDLGGTALTVGWKDQPEAELVGQITNLALAAAGADVTTRVAPVTSDALHDGLVAGSIDLSWDYMVDVWRGPLGRDERAPHDAGQMRQALNTADADGGVTWLGPTAFAAPYTLLVDRASAGGSGLGSLSDLAAAAPGPDAVLCAAQDPSALVTVIEDGYGLDLPDWQQVAAGDLYPRVSDGSCTLAVGIATDGAAAAAGLVPLDDDQGALGAANAALGVRARILDAHPEIEDLFAPIARGLDDATVRELNTQVVGGGAVRDVARRWLADQGFVAPSAPTAPAIADTFDLTGASFTLGSGGTDEQALLVEITRQALVEAGARVEVRDVPVGTAQARIELLAGRIDLYWEYLAKAWTADLGHLAVDRDPATLFANVVAADATVGITWLPPAAFDRGWAIVTTRERADELGVDSIADLEQVPDDPDDPGATLLCSEINDTGRSWIDEAYGFEIASFRVVDDDIEGLIDSGECRFGMVRASNPWVVGLDLVVLGDEQQALPPDRAAVSTRPTVTEQHPQLGELIAALGGTLTDDTIRILASRVVADGEAPADVAREWLQEAGLLG